MEFDLDSSSSQVTPKQLAALRSWIDTFPFMNEEQGFTDRPPGADLITAIVNLPAYLWSPHKEKKKGFRSIGRDFADGVRVAKIIKVFNKGFHIRTNGPGNLAVREFFQCASVLFSANNRDS